jgi:hypothetical protein
VSSDFAPTGRLYVLVCHSASLRTGIYWTWKLSEQAFLTQKDTMRK